LCEVTDDGRKYLNIKWRKEISETMADLKTSRK
jgi:hypothetical protein